MKSYPPFLDEIHEQRPSVSGLYTWMWRQKNESNKFLCTKEKVNNEYAIHWKTFKNSLRHLKKLKVLDFTYNQEQDKVKISLVVPEYIQKAS